MAPKVLVLGSTGYVGQNTIQVRTTPCTALLDHLTAHWHLHIAATGPHCMTSISPAHTSTRCM
eukprot:m.226506 g.226506  ORF g.226506 m.226506 type:complete len:63 (-) comp10844_c0_seq2:943-1131(-)